MTQEQLSNLEVKMASNAMIPFPTLNASHIIATVDMPNLFVHVRAQEKTIERLSRAIKALYSENKKLHGVYTLDRKCF